ncbi:MAG: hypothetical protein OEV30_01465 [Ignavibacteria bacterium]|nr:hypothetical protein [Ignavibacteria bacterium]
METKCVHSCRGLCAALERAERREREAIAEYGRFQAECDYPDVRNLLGELIRTREQSLVLLAETRAVLDARFDATDRVAASFR